MFGGDRIDNSKPNEIVRRGLVQITQSKDSFPAMTVEENLRLGAYCRADRRGVKDDLERTYDLFPVLKHRRRQIAATLSVGEVQMLVIGRGFDGPSSDDPSG